jgi:hypothetical protein
VTADDVRDTISVSAVDISDAKIAKMLKKAETTLKLETGRNIDYSNCTDEEALAITNLASIYALCHLTGGTAAGLSFSIGNQRVDISEKAPPLTVLQQEVDRILSQMKPTLKRT